MIMTKIGRPCANWRRKWMTRQIRDREKGSRGTWQNLRRWSGGWLMPKSEGLKFELVTQRVVERERGKSLVVNSRVEWDYHKFGYDKRIEVYENKWMSWDGESMTWIKKKRGRSWETSHRANELEHRMQQFKKTLEALKAKKKGKKVVGMLLLDDESPLVREVMAVTLPSKYVIPALVYKGKTDLNHHVKFNEMTGIQGLNNFQRCRVFLLTLEGQARGLIERPWRLQRGRVHSRLLLDIR